LQYEIHVTGDLSSEFVIAVTGPKTFKGFLVKQPGIITRYEYPAAGIFVIRTSMRIIKEQILQRPEVIFIDKQRLPKEEIAVSNLDLSVNKINVVHRWFPQYDGQSLTVSVKENLLDTLDIDFKGRYIPTPLASTVLSGHATIMATIIAGAGNSYYEGRGAAKAAAITSFTFSNLLPESDAVYQQYNISVQNHSYGTAIENYYGADAAAYDASVIARPSLLHVFSAGNSGTSASSNGSYAGINGFANITGSFKMAKNIITVGHVDSFGTVLAPSSKGPVYDGRVGPGLVAFSEDGSSGAAAIVSGIALLLQQAYRDLNGSLPSSALIRAVLYNSADDVAAKGIDFTSGYGMANAYRALQTIINGQYFSGTISTGGSNNYPLTIPPNIKQAKITLVWNDPPATANAAKALKNDLDLELNLPATGQSWQPWVLSHFPHIDSLTKLPLRKRDSLNTAEQITIDDPAPGNYVINIKGYNVTASAPQSYFIAYQFDTLQRFNWFYPTGNDNLFPGRSNTLRWQNSFTGTGQLEYTLDGISWQLIANAVDLSRGYYKWIPPVNYKTAMLRMNIAAQSFVSDTFTISDRISINIGFNCPDSFALWWNRIPSVNNYQLYRLGAKYMEPFLQTSDTLVVLSKQTNPSLHYAVAPVINNKIGLRSFAYNYTTQGVGCYIKSFFGILNNTRAELFLELGSFYNIRKISWEKLTPSGYITLSEVSPVQTLQFSYTDNSLKKGVNTYRVRIELVNGQVIYSQPETVFYFEGSIYLLYPNPVQRGQSLNLVDSDPDIKQIQLFNSTGVKLFEIKSNAQTIVVPTGRLSSGMYFVRIIKDNKPTVVLKIIVL
jgi:hypothetical protein